MSSEGDSDWQVIRATFEQLDRWLAVVSSPFEPDSGSELRGDQKDWPHLSLPQVAFQGLATAVEHLHAVRLHLDPAFIRRGQMFPAAHATLCRAALVAAAQSVWLLAPDNRAERLERQHRMIAEIQTRHLTYLTGLQDLDPAQRHANTDTVAAHVAARIQELAAKRDALGENAKTRFDTTVIIREAARAAFTSQFDCDRWSKR